MRLPLLLRKQQTKAAVEKMLLWRPERIILSHGRCLETFSDAADGCMLFEANDTTVKIWVDPRFENLSEKP
jgi:hypothetical protein